MRRALFLALAVSAGCIASQESSCEADRGPSPLPSPSPSVSPTVNAGSPTPTPNLCKIDFVTLRPVAGITLLQGNPQVLDLTPYRYINGRDGADGTVEVSAACNASRIPVWTSTSVNVIVSDGYNPVIKRMGLGSARVFAVVDHVVSNEIDIR